MMAFPLCHLIIPEAGRQERVMSFLLLSCKRNCVPLKLMLNPNFRLFREIIKLKSGHWGGPDPNDCPYKKRGSGHRHTEGQVYKGIEKRQHLRAEKKSPRRDQHCHMLTLDLQPPVKVTFCHRSAGSVAPWHS
jgi:hypothetical protein